MKKEALSIANNVHGEGVRSHKVGWHRRVFGSLRVQTLEKLSALWRSWSEQDWLVRKAVTWSDVKANIVVKLVATPVASDLWKNTRNITHTDGV